VVGPHARHSLLVDLAQAHRRLAAAGARGPFIDGDGFGDLAQILQQLRFLKKRSGARDVGRTAVGEQAGNMLPLDRGRVVALDTRRALVVDFSKPPRGPCIAGMRGARIPLDGLRAPALTLERFTLLELCIFASSRRRASSSARRLASSISRRLRAAWSSSSLRICVVLLGGASSPMRRA
jgi:hypothetical protein